MPAYSADAPLIVVVVPTLRTHGQALRPCGAQPPIHHRHSCWTRCGLGALLFFPSRCFRRVLVFRAFLPLCLLCSCALRCFSARLPQEFCSLFRCAVPGAGARVHSVTMLSLRTKTNKKTRYASSRLCWIAMSPECTYLHITNRCHVTQRCKHKTIQE